MSRKGYFFTLDAFLALIILTLGVGILLGYSVYSPEPQQVENIGGDVLNIFASLKIKDFNNPYYGPSGSLVKSGKINDTEKTLLQVLGQFYYYSDFNSSGYLISNFTEGYVSNQYKYEFLIDNHLIYPSSASEEHNLSKNHTNLLIPSKVISFGKINDSYDLFGPYEVKMLVWQLK